MAPEYGSIFGFNDYKSYLSARIKSLPKNGHGEMGRIAKHLGVSSVNISQIFRGDRDFTVEQAVALCGYLSLKGPEKEYFILMVSAARSGTKDLEVFYKEKMHSLKSDWTNAKNRVGEHRSLSESQKAVYYSDWRYGAVRISTSIDGLTSVKDLSKRLKVPEETVQEIADFLLAHGLCSGSKESLKITEKTTFIEKSSKLVLNHHRNWRLKSIQQMAEVGEKNFFYTSPLTISEMDRELVRETLLALVQKVSTTVTNSEPELLMCLNIDWFEF